MTVTNDGLDILQPTKAKLKTALAKSLATIDRKRSGFEDFHATATQAIMGGNAAQSLLFHALASPNVHPTSSGAPSPNPDDYPSLAELDVIENYIYSLVADRTDLNDTVVAVFAYQYREASRT
ncbi:MAG TPA: hypothetical protein VM553_01045, partial [Dongiaceae bacterium]|nr:hypothetical protein [Dongiaceae bacterium]